MLFKKNKPEQPQSPKSNVQGPPESIAGGGGAPSFFAPEVNPHSSPIDFGFDQVPPAPEAHSYIIPPPPPDHFSQPEPLSSQQMDWNAGLPQETQAFHTESHPPAQDNWNTQGGVGVNPVVEPLWEQPASPEVDQSAYLGTTFENYVAQAPEGLQGLGRDVAEAWQAPSPAPDAGFNPSAAYQAPEPEFAFDPISFESASFESASFEPGPPFSPEPTSQSMQPTQPTEWPSVFEQPSGALEWGAGETPALESPGPASSTEFSVTTGDAMPWEQSPSYEPPSALQSSAETLRHNLGAGNAPPGEQVSVSPGALLDSMHQQFYPEDPFGMEQGDVLAGQQAFEDAAPFLFPDTVSASLDWQPDDAALTADYALTPDFPASPELPPELIDDRFAPMPLDLGPSIQQPSTDMRELPGFEVSGTASTPYGAFPADDFSLLSPGLSPGPFPLPPEAGLSREDGVPFSPDAFSIEPGGFAEPVSPVWEQSEPVMGSGYGVVSGDSYTFDPQDTSGFSLAAGPLDAGYETAFSESPVPEVPSSEWDMNVADYGPIPADAYSAFAGAEEPATALPEISIETVPFDSLGDSFGDMEAVHWDPAVARQAELDALQMEPPVQPSENHQPEVYQSEVYQFEVYQSESGFFPEYNPQDTWGNGQADVALAETADFGLPPTPNASLWPASESEPLASVEQTEVSLIPPVSDQDFYATEFTLDAFGELVPLREEIDSENFVTPLAEPAPLSFPNTFETGLPLQEGYLAPPMTETSFTEETMPPFSFGQEPALGEAAFQEHFTEAFTEEPFIQESPTPLPEVPPAQGTSPFAQAAVPFVPPVRNAAQRVSPLYQQEYQPEALQSPAPFVPASESGLEPGSLEAQWHASPPVEPVGAVQSGTVAPPAGLSLGNLEVLGVCPLAADRRLLVVHGNGIFALMGQVGQENPNIFVLKVFENNPLAYQNTFTAVAEAQAAAQGMFVTQVGTWHGIVSTFQDKITLHTELG